MYLNDLNRDENARLRVANKFLKNQHGLTVSDESSLEELYNLRETIREENKSLQLKESYLHTNPRYNRNLLILEAVNLLIESKEKVDYDRTYENVLNGLVQYVTQSIVSKEPVGINEAVDIYKETGDSRYNVDVIESVLEQFFEEWLPETDDDYLDIDPKRPFSGVDKETRKAAADALTNMRMQKKSKGNVDKKQAMKAARARARKQLDKYSPSMVSRLKKSLGFGESITEGTTMKENFVKNLRTLLETEINQAEVLIAAKGFAQELQGMIEKIGRLQNEDLGPVVDQMRETYNNEMASEFSEELNGLLQNILEDLKSTQTRISTAVNDIAAGQGFNRQNDMDGNIDMEPGSELDLDVDAAGADVDVDDFGGDDAAAGGDEPLGRAKKESLQSLKKKIEEMQSRLNEAKKKPIKRN